MAEQGGGDVEAGDIAQDPLPEGERLKAQPVAQDGSPRACPLADELPFAPHHPVLGLLDHLVERPEPAGPGFGHVVDHHEVSHATSSVVATPVTIAQLAFWRVPLPDSAGREKDHLCQYNIL